MTRVGEFEELLVRGPCRTLGTEGIAYLTARDR
jgi:hypothetical protein